MPYPAKTSLDTIVAAALKLLETRGPAALSMRTLASELGVNASSLYHHVPNRAALEAALAEEGARALLTQLGAHAEVVKQPLTSVAQVYLAFARERPALYDLMFAPRPPAAAEPGASKDLWNFVLARVGEVTGRADDTAAAVAFWSFLHGFVSLERSGLFGLSGARGGLELGLQAFFLGLPKVEGREV